MILSAVREVTERIYRRIEWVGRRLVELVKEVKAFCDQIEAYMFINADVTRQAHIKRRIHVRDTHVSAEIAVCGEDAGKAIRINAGLAKRTVRSNSRPFVGALKIAVGIAHRENIERPARADLEDR